MTRHMRSLPSHHLLGLLAFGACLALSPLEAQSDLPGTEILALELRETASGAELEVRSAGSLSEVGVGFFEERGLVIQLPDHRPGVAVPDTLTGSGLVADVKVDTLASGTNLQTRILVRTRSDFSFAVSRGGGALLVTMTRPGAGAPSASDAELANLEASLGATENARAEMAARLETLDARGQQLEQRNRELEAVNAGLTTRNQELEGRLSALETSRSDLERGLANARAEMARLAETPAPDPTGMSIELQQAAAREVGLKGQIDALERSLADSETTRQQQSESIARLEDEQRRLTAERASLEETRRTLDGELDVARSEIAELRLKAARLAEVEPALEATRAREAELASDKAALESELEELRAQADSLTSRVVAANNEKTELETALGDFRTAEQALSGRISGLEADLEASRAALEARDAELASWQAEADRLAAAVEAGEAALRIARDENTELAASLAAEQSENARRYQRELAKEKANALEQALADSKAENERLEREHAARLAELAELEDEVARSTLGADESKGRVGELESDLAASRDLVRELTARLDEASADRDRLEESLDSLDGSAARVAALEARVEDLSGKLREAEGSREALETAVAAEREAADTASRTNAELEQKLAAAEASLAGAASGSERVTELEQALAAAQAAQTDTDALEARLAATLERIAGLETELELAESSRKAAEDALVGEENLVQAAGERIGQLERQVAVLAGERDRLAAELGVGGGQAGAVAVPVPPPAERTPVAAGTLGQTTGRVNLRTAPSLESQVLVTLDEGATVELLSRFGEDWVQVRADGRVGWISTIYLTLI